MGNNTTVATVGGGALAATIVIWLLGYFAPDLMATAPAGLEAAFGGLITIALTYFLPSSSGDSA